MLLGNHVVRFAALLLVAALLTGWTRNTVAAQDGSRAIFEGTVSDSSCKATHKTGDAKACIAACVGGGDKYVLVIGDAFHELEGNPEQFKQFAGEKVRVSATLEGNTLKVVNIGPIEAQS